MTEVQIRRAMNIVAGAADAWELLSLNQLHMPKGRRMTLHAGGQLTLTDVVFVDITPAHYSPLEQLAIARTESGDEYVITIADIYSLGLSHE